MLNKSNGCVVKNSEGCVRLVCVAGSVHVTKNIKVHMVSFVIEGVSNKKR